MRDLQWRRCMARRGLVIAVAALVALGGSATQADAFSPRLATRPAPAVRGERMVVTGTGFPRRGAGRLVLDHVRLVATFRTDSRGRFRATFVIPSRTRIGRHVVSASVRGRTGIVRSAVSFRVVRKPRPVASPSPSPGVSPPPSPSPAPTPEPGAFFVAPGGSDANPGTREAPWRTIQHAVDTASGVIYVRAGTYAGFTVTRSGLTISAYPGEAPTISGDSSRTAAVRFSGVAGGTLTGFTVQGTANPYGSGVKVKASSAVVIRGNLIRANHSFGVGLSDAVDTLVIDNEITANDTGIEVEGSAAGSRIVDNRIHDNNGMVDSGRGANGIAFVFASGPVVASGNRLWGNLTLPDNTTGNDGGAFEIYASSGVTMTGNVMWDNQDVIETGTDGSAPCDGLTFTRNIAWKAPTGALQMGLILRCASNSLVASNTLVGLDTFAFDLAHASGEFGGSIEGLRILDNLVAAGRAYSIDTPIPSSVQIDYDLAFPAPDDSRARYGDVLAYVVGYGNTVTMVQFRQWTGQESHGVQADPGFVDPATHDYRLAAGSPAIDAGIPLGDPYTGAAPDLGRWEAP